MKKTKIALSVILLCSLNATVAASEIGAEYNSYENGTGKNFFVDFGFKNGLKLNASYESIKMDEAVEIGNAGYMDFLKYGIGYNYNIMKDVDVYVNASKAKLSFDDVKVLVESEEVSDPTEDTVETETETTSVSVPDIRGYEYDAGIKYKFLNDYEIDLMAKWIDYKGLDTVKTYKGTLSYYITQSFKVNVSYADDSFVKENSYNVGLSYKF